MNKSPFCRRSAVDLLSILCGRPRAAASIVGSKDYPGISGSVRLYQANAGVIVLAQVTGLPQSDIPCQERAFGFHIHEGTDCGGDVTESKAGSFCESNACRFGLWKDNKYLSAKKITLTKRMASALLKDRRAFISGIHSEKPARSMTLS